MQRVHQAPTSKLILKYWPQVCRRAGVASDPRHGRRPVWQTHGQVDQLEQVDSSVGQLESIGL